MSILFRKSGILTTVQDLGRSGYRRFGINPSGAMDRTAVRLINILLGNDENEAVLEIHFPAPEILFESDAEFALGGADFSADLNGKSIENWVRSFAEKGSILSFKQKKSGNRAYISIGGGFAIKEILKSKSTNLTAGFGGFEGRKIKQNDRIKLNPVKKNKHKNLRIANSLIPFYSKFPTVRVIAGAEFEYLTALSEQDFLKTNFVITNESNRMGFRLFGKSLYLLDKREIVSSAVDFGIIQLLPNGQMIILMADHQTTGGYPRIASVVSVDLPLVAQLGTNDKIAFHLVSQTEAENLALEFETNLNFLRTAVKLSK